VTDGRTDRPTDRIAVASIALAMRALRRAVKMSPVIAEPTFTVKIIDCLHQTGRRKGAEYPAVRSVSVTVSVPQSKMGVVLHPARVRYVISY